MSSAPLNNTMMTPDELTAELPPAVSQTSSEGHGGGVGVGSLPGDTGGPADAKRNSAQTSAPIKSERLIEVSPMVVMGRDGCAVRTPHSTTTSPEDLALYRALVSARNLSGASELCAERLLLAPDGQPSATWTKDAALVRFHAGDYAAALELLASRYATARAIKGAFLGRYEHSLGLVFQYLGQTDKAFDYYTSAHHHAEADPILRAQIDTNTGRCYTSANRPEDSHSYFNRAYQVALQSNDILLQAEIDESRALAFEAEGNYREALTCAAHSLYLLAPTAHRLARAESGQTYRRIEGEV
jgi:tetratricopeptide (TPR) repeat protein